ncbi:ATP-dependent DNA helicase UvsW [Gammaproteobacteria bacterium]
MRAKTSHRPSSHKVLLHCELTITVAPADLVRIVQEANTYPNPAYLEATRSGRSTRGIDCEIRTYQDLDGTMVLPRGYFADLLALSPDFQVEDRRTDVRVDFPLLQGVTLRSYQERAISDALKAEQGVIEAPTGAGKSLTGLGLLSHLGHRALLMVHSRELARQWREVIATRLGIEAGMVGAGQWEEGEIVTVAMLQTLHRNPERTRDMGKGYGVTLLDECHHVPALTFAEVLSWLPARYRYGLSATPHRRDGLDVLIHRVIGPTLSRVSREEVEMVGGTVPVMVKVLETNIDPGNVSSWAEFIDSLTTNESRNRLIITTAERAAGRMSVLVLVERVQHAEALAALATIPCVLVHGAMPAKERSAAIDALPLTRLTIGTVGMLGEGLDVASWGALVLASPVSSRVRLLQAFGRVVRPHAGKTRGYVADFLDSHPLAWASFRKRQAIYREQQISVVSANPQNTPTGERK